jgi:hypothetical protein
VFKPFSDRLDTTVRCESNRGDPDLIIHVPFVSSVRVKSLAVSALTDSTTPTTVDLYVNRNDIDFSTAEDTPPTQRLMLSVDPASELFYPLRAALFASVSSLTLVLRGCQGGGDFTSLCYIGMKGIASGHRRGIVTAVYEAKPLPQDHRVPDDQKGTHDSGF